MIEITWLGHSAFQIRLEGGEIMLIDPWLDGNPSFPVGFPIARADFILVSHGHADHLGDTLGLAKKHGAPVLANYETCMWLQSKGVENIAPMNKGGGQQAGSARVTMTHAMHSSSLEDGGKMVYGGEPGGFIVESAPGKAFFFAGDTDVFGDMALIEQIYQPALAFLPIGDLFTMGPRQAAVAARLLKPKKIIPMHYGTFPFLTGTPQELTRLVASQGVEVWTLEPGKTVQW